MVQLQNSDLSLPARSLVPLLRDLEMPSPALQQAASRLLQWNYVLDKDSVEAGIYEMWQHRLEVNVGAAVVPKAAEAFIQPWLTKIVSWMHAPDGRFGADPIAGRNALLLKSLEEATAELSKRFGPGMEKWRLGAFHYARILNPLTDAVTPELQEKFDVGHAPRGGDSFTVTATSAEGDNQIAGGSFKIIVDTENWDNSVGLNRPGQSGDINSPHYRDLYELWARGKYFPIFYSRSKVESVAEATFLLTPSSK
jgi:penicillin amidase